MSATLWSGGVAGVHSLNKTPTGRRRRRRQPERRQDRTADSAPRTRKTAGEGAGRKEEKGGHMNVIPPHIT